MPLDYPTRKSYRCYYHPKAPLSLFEPVSFPPGHGLSQSNHYALKKSISEHGLANPLVAIYRPDIDPRDYFPSTTYVRDSKALLKITVGLNRYKVIKELGWTHIPVMVCSLHYPPIDGMAWEHVLDADLPLYFKDGTPVEGIHGLAIDNRARVFDGEQPDGF